MILSVDNWLQRRTGAQCATQILAFSQCQLCSTELTGKRPTRPTTHPTAGHKHSRAIAPDQRRTERDAPAVLFGNERDWKVGTFARARSSVEQASNHGALPSAIASQQAILGDTREPIANLPGLPAGLAFISEAAC